MKIRVVVEVDVNFDLESDGETHTESAVDSDVVGQAVVEGLNNSDVADSIVELISDRSGWCVSGLTLSTPEAECIDYLE